MKIAFLINHLALHGGIEKITSQKIDGWIDQYGYEVIVITKNQNGKPLIYPIKNQFKHIDLCIKNNIGGKLSYIKNLWNYIIFFLKLGSILKEEKIDIVFTTLTSVDSLIVPFVKRMIPKVLELHSSGHFLLSSSWKYKKKIIAKYNAVVVLNNDEVDYYQLDNIKVIPNFVDLLPENDCIIERDKVIIAAGRIDPIKQFGQLAEIWSSISHKVPNWRVHIYGSGSIEETDIIKNIISKHHIEESFILMGSTNELSAVLKNTAIYAMTSYSECFPMVLLEAMDAGAAIISYDCPNGPRNIITNGEDGYLIPLNKKEEFAQKLEQLINNQTFRETLSLRAKTNIQKFSKSQIMQKWHTLILDLKIKNN